MLSDKWLLLKILVLSVDVTFEVNAHPHASLLLNTRKLYYYNYQLSTFVHGSVSKNECILAF